MNKLEIQEKAFQSHIEAEKVAATRTMCVLGAILYMVFIIADLMSLSVTLSEVLIIRGTVVVLLLIPTVISFTSYLKIMVRYYDLLLAILFLIAAAGIEAMIYLATPSDHAYYVYFTGLILVIMSIFSWSYSRFTTSLAITMLIIVSYSYIEIIKGISISSLAVNIVFLVSAAVISFMSQNIRDRYMRENFYLQQSLKESVKEKTLEAKDNAYLANHDALTDLPNRRYITELLEESLQIAKEKDKVLAILFFDLNGFKQINDIYGHAVGDEVLIIVAKRLELAIRRGDHISRLGGDEYLVGLMMDKEHVSEISSMAEKFTAIISEPMNVDGNIVKVGASIGVAAYPMHGNNVNVLIDIADKKMYNIKQGLEKDINESDENEEQEAVVIFPGNSKSNR